MTEKKEFSGFVTLTESGNVERFWEGDVASLSKTNYPATLTIEVPVRPKRVTREYIKESMQSGTHDDLYNTLVMILNNGFDNGKPEITRDSIFKALTDSMGRCDAGTAVMICSKLGLTEGE